ncbi:hypothetical protein IHP33_11980 [Enterococcus faecalis]|uniref:hypothetical protein n=1 Tax=Enterococcus faecalis TaxID=1351 RepID=UPI00177FB63A|nr:hypothetical protein [Enterococcus faecalis]MBD9846438.1 hypothetical protein [Enterococcus faecalis]
MLYYEFREYLETHAKQSLDLFIAKATEYQEEKNKNRKKDKRWNEVQIQRAVNQMLDQLIDNAYEQIKAKKGVPKYNGTQIWIDFMNEYEFLEMFSDGINEMEFFE